ncbi:MAG: dienelactone hydrolase family protein [Armatimonadetes bacterium]|nr:dienelactone hydrolase family protein [Armatimonadota bacterium]
MTITAILPAFCLLAASNEVKSCCSGDMSQFLNDPAFLAAHMEPIAPATPATGGKMRTFDVPTVGKVGAYWVAPKAGSYAAVIMIHEWWGLNEQIKLTAEKLNQEAGYGVLAIDLYNGKSTSNRNEAGKLMGAVDNVTTRLKVQEAVKALKGGKFGFKPAKIGTVGYCFGGGWSYWTAALGGNNVQACAIYYGMPDSSPEVVSKLKAPVLFIHANKDKWINNDVVNALSAEMTKEHKSIKVLNYDADHGFANPSNPIFDKAATEDAWKHLMEFFKANLGR